MINHTFLFDQKVWIATGVYFDSTDTPVPATGESKIIHQGGLWIVESTVRVFGDAPLEIKNRYEVIPFSDDTPFVAHWKSAHTTLGRLSGKFVIVDDTILSIYQSEESTHSGTEVLAKIEDGYYESRGCLFTRNNKVSSWAFELRHA